MFGPPSQGPQVRVILGTLVTSKLKMIQWLFLVPVKRWDRWHIIPQLAGKLPLIYHLYIACWKIIRLFIGVLGCPRKIGSMVSTWVATYLEMANIGVITHLLTF